MVGSEHNGPAYCPCHFYLCRLFYEDQRLGIRTDPVAGNCAGHDILEISAKALWETIGDAFEGILKVERWEWN